MMLEQRYLEGAFHYNTNTSLDSCPHQDKSAYYKFKITGELQLETRL
jgi:hypothetical protein